ncbi:MAG TPA: RNA-binding transcriptional accessory protein [Firmicutes bacterium]|nr:RNA-binding transcriptional accessory protein [Bacillota bacterium]
MDIIKELATELGLSEAQVSRTVELLEQGNTLPFIARYRKEVTGGLDDEQLKILEERLNYLRNLQARKEEVLRLIDEQGKLTEDLANQIKEATKLQEVEEYYRPFRPKRRTRATIAREKGLAPLAALIKEESMTEGSLEQIVGEYLRPDVQVNTVEQALAGAMDIVAEEISDDHNLRRIVREFIWEEALICSELKEKSSADAVADATEAAKEGAVYRQYHHYTEAVKKIPPHRILAINRGEKEGYLKVELQLDKTALVSRLERLVVKNTASIFTEYLHKAVEDSFSRLIWPSIEREIRANLTEKAEEQAIKVFAMNLRQLLLQPPVRGRRVMGIDPGFRTGCKVAVVDEIGRVMATETIYPHPPINKTAEARQTVAGLISDYQVELVAIGNGTASRETEEFIADLLAQCGREVYYCLVSEAGASVYSASKLAREELPDLDVSMRGTISIARRLQDPLAELVKIEPKSIGVGQYQHDVNQKELGDTLQWVVESCVNFVGVDLNTASPALLQNVAGIGPSLAKAIVEYREANGAFKKREELLKVKRLGKKAFVQAAGFLRLPDGENPLENTGIHPESYQAAEKLLTSSGFSREDLRDGARLRALRERLQKIDLEATAERLGVGVPTLKDIVEALAKPGRDPREEMPKPLFRKDVKTLADLRPGMVLTGEVRNVVDFGAFVDIGVKEDGLVHISELSERYVKHPVEVVSVGQTVNVRVLKVDLESKRISLSMKDV